MFIFDVFYPRQRWLNINSYCMESHSFFVVFVYGVECSLFIYGSFVYSLARNEGLRRPAYLFSWTEAGHGPAPYLRIFCLFANAKREPPAASLFSWTEAGHGPAPYLRIFCLFANAKRGPPAASLFSWTEAGHGPAPYLRLLFHRKELER